MIPLGEHQLLIFWVQLAVLLVGARALGGLMRRIGQPPVVGELAAGLVLGPSLLGRLAPDVHAWLFPEDPVQSALLLAVAWVGIALLLVTIGFETDLGLLARLGRPAAKVATGSLLLPLAACFAVGFAVPTVFLGEEADALTFALFLALGMSISALAIVGRILADMRLMRRNVGQVMIGSVVANDIVGWVLLGIIAGVAADGRFDVVSLATTVLAIAAFLVLALTLGQRLVDRALRAARHRDAGFVRSFTVVVVAAVLAGAISQAIGVEAVFGAFVAGILLGRSRYHRAEVEHALETVTYSFLAPLFFATAGLFVDLGFLADPVLAGWVGLLIAIAAATKLAGSFVGARLGGLGNLEGLALGVGLNARGTLEIVVATVALGLGVFNATSFSAVVVLAMVTSMAAPPLLRALLGRLQPPPEEAARLERERLLEESVVANTRNALLPTRGGENSILAGRILGLSLQPDTTVTVYTVRRPADPRQARTDADAAAGELKELLAPRRVERIDRSAPDLVEAIRTEASLGYGVLALGMTERGLDQEGLSPVLQALLTRSPVPILLVRHGIRLFGHADDIRLRRILVPATGTRPGRAAQEIAYTLGQRVGAPVDVVHVVDRPDRAVVTERASLHPLGSVASMLATAESLAGQFGCQVRTLTRYGPTVGPELHHAADEAEADLIVVGTRVRRQEGQPFLGHGVEYLLEHAGQTVLALLLPAEAGEDAAAG